MKTYEYSIPFLPYSVKKSAQILLFHLGNTTICITFGFILIRTLTYKRVYAPDGSFNNKFKDLTHDENSHAGQGQPGQIRVGFFSRREHQEAQRGGAVKFGHQVEVNPKCCGADGHCNT